ncbi:MAG: diheme cytochrome c-553 [Bacteroidetes bacterium]|nr:diheme cytochrome c-553 [Bacteroidota bacterium]MBS1972736.1 diheme cytochrome c-553 [Bacteroidota bacterium]
MKKHFFIFAITLGGIAFLQFGCDSNQAARQPTEQPKKEMTKEEQVVRGKYLVTGGGCGDCHNPKLMSPQGPVPDTTKLLSGHPAAIPIMPIDKNALKPGNWVLFSPDLTMAVGPWGITYSANLTPDTATGLGAWTAEQFIKTMRTGKHLGQEGGRALLPPMPWQNFATFTDEDLKAIFAYLQALPPISNKVPPPASPDDVAKMK